MQSPTCAVWYLRDAGRLFVLFLLFTCCAEKDNPTRPVQPTVYTIMDTLLVGWDADHHSSVRPFCFYDSLLYQSWMVLLPVIPESTWTKSIRFRAPADTAWKSEYGLINLGAGLTTWGYEVVIISDVNRVLSGYAVKVTLTDPH